MTSEDGAEEWKATTRTHFDSEVAHYARERESMPYFQAQLRLLFELLGAQRGTALSIGCAAGAEFRGLIDRGCHVAGIDYSLDMLRVARRRFASHPGVSLARADAERLPFPDATFDIVTCLGVLEYLPSYDPTLRETRRVLRPGGVAVFSVPTRVSQWYVASRLAEFALGRPWRALKRLRGTARAGAVPDSSHQRNPCTPWGLRKQLAAAGLTPGAAAYNSFFVYPLDRLAPDVNVAVADRLQRPLERSPLGWLGAQYLVAATAR